MYVYVTYIAIKVDKIPVVSYLPQNIVASIAILCTSYIASYDILCSQSLHH